MSGGLTIRPGDVGRPQRGVATGRTHDIRFKPEAVPIIFVPGIMGSRLAKRSGGTVEKIWDPDAPDLWNGVNYPPIPGMAARKKRSLVGDEKNRKDPYTEQRLTPYTDDADHNDAVGLSPDERARGWGGVYWGSYGAVLHALAAPALGGRVARLGRQARVETPVHACAYNWTASNRTSGKLLADYIKACIQTYQQQGYTCTQVVLVTHSMGGLVARSACVLHGAAGSVLGVVHGAQPATGAPAAYWRMKAGFERGAKPLQAKALGYDGRDVVALLGNMPGGLELLPGPEHRANAGGGAWLRWPTPDGDERALPQQDACAEIYESTTDPWRLVEHPDWLTPELPPLAAPADGPAFGRRRTAAAGGAWDRFVDRMGAARGFHQDLGLQQHPRTAHFYGVRRPTTDVVGFDVEEVTPPLAAFGGRRGQPDTADALCATFTAREANAGTYVAFQPALAHGRTDYPLVFGQPVRRLTMRPGGPDDSGDGTVPEGSGRALAKSAGTVGIKAFVGFEHQDAYAGADVQRFVLDVIASFLPAYARQRS